MSRQKAQRTPASKGAPAPVIFVDGDKGGVGKSFIGRTASHVLCEESIQLTGFDGDGRNAHLARFYSSVFHVERVMLRDPEGWSRIINHMATLEPHCAIIVDLPGNSGDAVAREMPRFQRAAERVGRSIFRVWAIDEEDDSINLLRTSHHVVPYSNTVVVMNGRFGSPHMFELWATSETRAQLLAAGGLEIYLPVLPVRVRTKIRNARCSFAQAANLQLELSERMDLELWLLQAENAFAPFMTWL